MPSSRPHHIPEIISIVRKLRPASILDIGVGFGKWGVLFREYTDIIASEKDPLRYRRENWRVRIDGVEVFEDYLTDLHRFVYNKIFVGDVRQLLPELGRYELIFLGDVIEHFDKPDGAMLLRSLYELADKSVLVTTPASRTGQGVLCANEYETHRSLWRYSDFRDFPNRRVWRSRGDILIAMLAKPGIRLSRIVPGFGNLRDAWGVAASIVRRVLRSKC